MTSGKGKKRQQVAEGGKKGGRKPGPATGTKRRSSASKNEGATDYEEAERNLYDPEVMQFVLTSGAPVSRQL